MTTDGLNTASEGPVGIWTYDSDGVVIQHNESYRNRTNGTADGGGYDLDQNTRNSIVQYNYSHDNDGPGFLLAHSPNNTNHTGNIVRYNITQNDGRRNAASAIVIWGRTIGAEIYNNSVYLKPSASGASRAVHVHNATVPANDVKYVHFRNNAFFADSGATMLFVSAGQLSGAIDLRFEGNNYFGRTAPPKFIWGSSTYVGNRRVEECNRSGAVRRCANRICRQSAISPRPEVAGRLAMPIYWQTSLRTS